jgi:hypothetical protein
MRFIVEAEHNLGDISHVVQYIFYDVLIDIIVGY